MADNTPTEKRNFFNDKKFSDVTIKFGNQQIFAHRVILSSGSVWFEKALCGDFSEANKEIIELHDDANPDEIMAMLRHLYGENYQKQEISVDDSDTAEFHSGVFMLGDKYDIRSLREQAKKRFIKFLEAELKDGEFYHGTIYAFQTLVGPSDLQLADQSLIQYVENLVLDNALVLFRDDTFRELLAEGKMLKTELAIDFLVRIQDNL